MIISNCLEDFKRNSYERKLFGIELTDGKYMSFNSNQLEVILSVIKNIAFNYDNIINYDSIKQAKVIVFVNGMEAEITLGKDKITTLDDLIKINTVFPFGLTTDIINIKYCK